MSEENIESRIETALFDTPPPAADPEPEQTELQLVPDAEEAEEVETEAEGEGAQKLEDLEQQETLASVLGIAEEQIDVRDNGEVILKASVDGEEVEVPLKDMLAAYQGTEFASKKSQEVIEQQQKLEQEIAEVQQAAQEKLGQMQKVSTLMEKELLAEYNGHDWQRLSQENPAEYNRLKDMYSTKAQRLKSVQESLVAEEKQQQEQAMETQKARYQQHLKVESEKILAANPTWHNPQVKEKEMGDLRSFLNKNYGYSDEEINQIADSRLVKLIQDAYKIQAPAETVKSKKVVPAFQTPSGGRAKAAANARAAKARKAALRKTGSTDALTQVLLDRM